MIRSPWVSMELRQQHLLVEEWLLFSTCSDIQERSVEEMQVEKS